MAEFRTIFRSPERSRKTVFRGGAREGFRLSTRDPIEQQLTVLERAAEVSGAPTPEQDQPGFFRRTIDVLSGFNFAVAGFAEELLFEKNGLPAALSRATRELLSSARSLPFGSAVIPEVEAQKETFGEVLEQAGFGTVSLGDVLPALEGTLLGNLVNTRGAVGIALDIAADPLTYFTFGIGGAVRRTFVGTGKKFLSRKGEKLFRDTLESTRKEVLPLLEPGSRQGIDVFRIGRQLGLEDDLIQREVRSIGFARELGIGDVSRVLAQDTAKEVSESLVREAALRRSIERFGAESIFDPGGIKFWGRPVVKGKTIRAIGSKFGERASVAASRVLGPEAASKIASASEATYKGLRKYIAGIFHSHERLLELPDSTKSVVIAIARRMRRGEYLLQGRLNRRIQESDWLEYFKKNPNKVEEAVDAIEDGTIRNLKDLEQRRAAQQMADFGDELGADAVSSGLITEAQFKANRGRFFAHFYENSPEEFTEIWAQWRGGLKQVAGKHDQERVFNSLKNAKVVSGLLKDVTETARKAGIKVPKSPELIPNLVLEDVWGRYIRWYTSNKARMFFAHEVSSRFGTEVEKLTSDKLVKIFESLDPADISQKAALQIAKRLDDPKASPLKKKRTEVTEDIVEREGPRGLPLDDEDVKRIDEMAGAGLQTEENVKSVLAPLDQSERAFINGLEKGERREYFRQVLQEMNSQSQVVDFLGKYSEYIDDLPRLRRDLTGSTEAVFARFGEEASEYVIRGGNELWGPKPIFMPRLIARYIDEAPPSLLNTKDYATLRKSIDFIDWNNNWFKLGVYPLFPASGTRDLYSNVWFNSFRIGWNAFNPFLWAQSLKVLAHMSDSPGTVRALNRVFESLGMSADTITTRSGRVIDVAEAARQLRQRNVLLTGEELLELNRRTGRVSLQKPGRVRRGVDFVVKQVREPLDNSSRVALATQNLIDDIGFDDAAEEVAQYLFNYNEIPAFSREIVSRLIPFARFSIKNIEFHFNMLRRRPGAVANRLKPFRGREDERGHMVKWEAESLQWRIDRDGKTLRTIMGIDLPTRNMDLLWRGNIKNTMRMAAGMVSPIFKAPLEIATGRDFFTGRVDPRVDSAALGRFFDRSEAPRFLKDWVGFKKEFDAAGRPKYSFDRLNLAMVFLRSFMFSRVISTTDRQFREFLNEEGVPSMLLDVMSGLRLQEMNLDEEQQRRFFRRRRELVDVLERRGVADPFRVPGRLDLEGLE